jgi:hypothetical protein
MALKWNPKKLDQLNRTVAGHRFAQARISEKRNDCIFAVRKQEETIRLLQSRSSPAADIEKATVRLRELESEFTTVDKQYIEIGETVRRSGALGNACHEFLTSKGVRLQE